MLNRWCEYCENLISSSVEDRFTTSEYTINRHERHILKSKIRIAIKTLRNNKSAGTDGIFVGMSEAVEEYDIETLYLICNQIWKICIWHG